jgi:hypothetical protein
MEKKYLKYKNKYLKLKNKTILSQKGGENNRIILYVIFGLGCSTSEKEIKKDQQIFSDFSQIPISNVNIICRPWHDAILSIGSTFIHRQPMHHKNFLRTLAMHILTHAIEYDKVIVYGHSYGGAIVNRIAEELNDKDTNGTYLSKIFMSAFGSIYITQPSRVNLLNYVFIGDVALKLNHLADITLDILDKDLKDKDGKILLKYKKSNENIIRLCDYDHYRNLCTIHKKGILFGNREEWAIHNRYNYLMFYLIGNYSNNIEDSNNNINIWTNLKFKD